MKKSWVSAAWRGFDAGVDAIRRFLDNGRGPTPDLWSALDPLLLQSKEGIAIFDEKGLIRVASPNSMAIIGFSAEQLTGRSILEFIHPDDRERAAGAVAGVSTSQGAIKKGVYRVLHAERGYISIEVTIQNHIDNPNILGMVINVRDITDRIGAHSALEASEDKFAKAFWSSPLLMAISRLDNSVILAVNPAFERLGYVAAEVVGKTAAEAGFWPSDADREAMRKLVLEQDHVNNIEFDFCGRDGSLRRAVGSFETIEWEGVTCILTIAFDITGRAAIERELRQTKSNLAVIFENTEDAIWSVDLDYNFVTFNSSLQKILRVIFGVEIRPGMNFAEYESPEEIQFWREAYSRAVRDGAFRLEKSFSNQYAHSTVEFSFNPILQDGKVVGVSAYAKDVTKQRDTLDQLQKISTALTISEAEYRSLFVDTPIPMFVSDAETLRFLRVNEAFVKLYGYSEEELLGMFIVDIRPADTQAEFRARISPLMQQGKSDIKNRAYHLRKGGEIIEVDIFSQPSVFEGRAAWVTVIEDVTQRLRAERSLAAANERFQLAWEPMTSVVYDVDLLTGTSTRSGGMMSLLGFELSEDIGTVEWWISRIHPEDKEQAAATMTVGLAQGRILESEYRMKHKDGHFVDIWDRALITRDEAGKAVRLIGSAQDISARVNAEREASEANERFRLATEAVSSVIYDWDLPSGRCIFTQGLLRLLGFDPRVDLEVNSATWWDSRMHPEDAEQIRSVTQLAAEGKNEFEYEYRMKHRDGHYVYVWDRGVMARDLSGTAVRVVGSTQDITARKRMEVQLAEEKGAALIAKDKAEEMSRLKTSFLANMSHEIRTPMTAILGFASIIAEGSVDSEISRYAQIIESSGKRLLDTINSILDLAKVESKRIELHPEEIDLQAEIQRILEMFRPIADVQGNALSFAAAPHTRAPDSGAAFKTFIDLQYFNQILTNLIGNALKFTKKGEVTVSLEMDAGREREGPVGEGMHRFRTSALPEGSAFSIAIRDTGVGISPEFLPRVFDEFRQESTGYSRRFEGTGLGLTIISRLVEVMQGSIEVISAPSKGSTFIVRLPRQMTRPNFDRFLPQTELDLLIVNDPGKTDESHVFRILAVEDAPETAEMIQAFLLDRARVEVAPDSSIALGMITRQEFDLILMDVNLGNGISGLDLTRYLREDEKFAHIPIIALTAYAMTSDRETALAAGCNEYLSKPFNKIELLQTIERVLSRSLK